MLKLLFQLFLLLILSAVAYDFITNKSLEESQSYKYLKDYGALDYGHIVLGHLKKSYKSAYKWSEKNVPVYYNETCTYLKPYINLSYDLSLALKNSAFAVIHNLSVYVNKNFPGFQNYVSEMISDSLTIAKQGLIVISSHLQNYTMLTVQYASNMFE